MMMYVEQIAASWTLRYHLDLMERNPELKARTFQRVRQALDCL